MVLAPIGGVGPLLPAPVPAGIAVYNVRSYGAVGNGMADDAPAVRSAITAAAAVRGATLYFPAGTYRLASVASTGK